LTAAALAVYGYLRCHANPHPSKNPPNPQISAAEEGTESARFHNYVVADLVMTTTTPSSALNKEAGIREMEFMSESESVFVAV
jgi:hypothetical protein